MLCGGQGQRMHFNQLRRREFITLLGGAAVAWPLAARAQQGGKLPRLGILSPGRSELPEPGVIMLDAFVQGLQDLGYAEGRNLILERRYAEWRPERLRELAAELAGAGVDVIVAFATPAAGAAKQATSAIPIVAVAVGDPPCRRAGRQPGQAGRQRHRHQLSRAGADGKAAAAVQGYRS